MKKKNFTQNDIIWAQGPTLQGKTSDITVISLISINSNDKDDEK